MRYDLTRVGLLRECDSLMFVDDMRLASAGNFFGCGGCHTGEIFYARTVAMRCVLRAFFGNGIREGVGAWVCGGAFFFRRAITTDDPVLRRMSWAASRRCRILRMRGG